MKTEHSTPSACFDQLVGPGVDVIRGCHPTYRRLWRTIVRDVGGGFVVFPSWCSRIAIAVELPFVVWDNGRAHVAMNKGIDECEWQLMVIGPVDLANSVVEAE